MATVVLVGLVGCFQAQEPPRAESEPMASSPVAAAEAPSGAVAAPGGPPGAEPSAGRLVIRTASVRLRADSPQEVGNRVGALGERLGGYVESGETFGDDAASRQVSMGLRVPVARFDEALHGIRKLGTVLREAVHGEDVTERVADLGARLRAKRQLEERLLQLATHAGSLKDTLEVERELSRVRAEIEQMDAQQRGLRMRSAMARIEVVALAAEQPPVASAESFGSRMGRAWSSAQDGFTSVLAGLVEASGVVAPLLGLLALVVWPIRRLLLRRRMNATG